MSLLVLSAQDVSTITAALPSAELEALMASVFRRLSSGSHYTSPQRTSITMTHHTALFVPSRVEDIGTAIKVVSVPTSADDKRGLPASTILLDEETGRVKAIVNASALTALRTAAGRCTIVNRSTNARLENLLSVLRQSHPLVALEGLALDDTTNVRSAVGHANVICTATSSTRPLFPSEWVSPGTHLNLVGSFKPSMVEVDCDLISRAETIVVDSIEACAIEAGELIAAGLGAGDMIEIGRLVEEWDFKDGLGDIQMRKGDLTVFKSVGIGLQDVAIARYVVSKAESFGIGTTVVDFHA
ncbi:NAD-binding protein [Pisolithus orientalis]|uniref:NAD-binding protein n=1 Tax=Pisolithus orientalis TaxID=936130 RepID=UPI00222426BF|nr:NAD-binding protein [Pisolithus orientalis]KAI5992568.1 NAD-binding protein [Pisolithus orientalis]